ncbi:glucose-1-phosphate thymidylyltransferase [Bacteroidetes/Chlorobi group bacterium Naka2016]|jgi:glucose-1-phosphate thymidylyltransferase|nr:MAG: glucose-1-phosphate thymidylyltransferase [Bacteroidetes/Chlorobi group bacterium Naka2016]
MKGLILAGGKGTRLYPSTNVISKQLLPIFDKPMIYYPIATLMLGGIRDIVIISTPTDIPNYQELLGDGKQWGLSFEYCVQEKPEGIAQAFIITKDLIKNEKVCLILGDNLFYGKLDFFRNAIKNLASATIFAYEVENPQSYGVVVLDKDKKPIDIIEKPKVFVSKWAIPGLYLFDERVSEFAKRLQPSSRGELEITDLQKMYLAFGELQVEIIGRGIAWLDTGTPSNLIDAALFIRAIEQRQGRKIACLEEIALNLGYITKSDFIRFVEQMPDSDYKRYCIKVYEEHSE